jgi:hypothetical protein
MSNYFNSLCNPAKLYAVLIAITLLLALFNGVPIIAIVIKLIFAIIWTCVLNYICGKGFTWFSWLLVLLPFVLLIMGVLGIMKMAQSQQLMQSMQLQ